MYYYYCTMWYGAEVILLFFQESWLEALKTRVALQGLNHAYFSLLYTSAYCAQRRSGKIGNATEYPGYLMGGIFFNIKLYFVCLYFYTN